MSHIILIHHIYPDEPCETFDRYFDDKLKKAIVHRYGARDALAKFHDEMGYKESINCTIYKPSESSPVILWRI